MYARIASGQPQSITYEERISRVRDIVAPFYRQQKGFKNLYVLFDRQTGKSYSITFWESEEDLKAFESGKAAELGTKLREAGAIPLNFENFEVVFEA